MKKPARHSSSDGATPAQRSALDDPKRLLAGFSHASSISFATPDQRLRYHVVNRALAEIHGISVDAHDQMSVRDLLKEVAAEVEPVFKLVMMSGEPVLNFGLAATLPGRTQPGYWIGNYFPIRDRAGRVTQVGVIVIEVTKQKKLERSLHNLSISLLASHSKGQLGLARELLRSLNRYHTALTIDIGRLITRPPSSVAAVDASR